MPTTPLVRAREFPLRDPSRSTIVFALNLLKLGEGGVMPDTYGADIRHGLNYAVFKGWAVQAASERLEITDAGRKELKSSLHEPYD